MFASNMKISPLSKNTASASPVLRQNVGCGQALSPAANRSNKKICSSNANSGNVAGSVSGSCNNLITATHNKPTNIQSESNQKNNNRKAKYEHSNNNTKMQQQQQQQQQKKYNNNNNNNNSSSIRIKRQSYNSIGNNNNNYNNCNNTSSLNRKKYQQQQQQHNYHRYQHKQQAQYLKITPQEHKQHLLTLAPSKSITTTTNPTNFNNNISLAKDQHYATAALPNSVNLIIQQQQQNHRQNNSSNPITISTYTEAVPPKRLLQQENCEKSPTLSTIAVLKSPTISSVSTTKATSSTAALKLPTTSSIVTTTKVSSSTATCVSCWTNLSKFSKSTTTLANSQKFVVVSAVTTALTAAASSNCITTNQNNTKTTTKTSSCSSEAIPTLTTTALSCKNALSSKSSLVTKNKSFCKNSNFNLIEAASTSVNSAQSPTVNNEKVSHNILVKNLTVSTGVGKSSGASNNKISNNQSYNYRRLNNNGALNGVTANIPSQHKQISKHQAVETIEKPAMTTAIIGNDDVSSVVSIKKTAPDSTTSINTISKNVAAVLSSKQETNTCDNNNECKSDSNITNINTSSTAVVGGEAVAESQSNLTASSTTISPNSKNKSSSPTPSYSLDFLHSVGVKITGVTMRSSQATPLASYGGDNQLTLTSQVHNNGTYGSMSSNQRQPRYVYGANSNNTNNNANRHSTESGSGRRHYQQQYHYHHQPKQLTIASFLKTDLLKETESNGDESKSSNASSARNTSSYNDQQQQTLHNQRYHHSMYASSPYRQRQQQHQAMVMPNTNYMSRPGVSACTKNASYEGDLPRLASNNTRDGGGFNGQRMYTAYPDYHNLPKEGLRGAPVQNNTIQGSSTQLQNNARYLGTSPRIVRNNKSYASSITSSCSTSSSKSISSSSSKNSSRQLPTKYATNQESIKSSKNLNLPIEILPVKPFGTNGINHRNPHRRHHYHQHNLHNYPQHYHYSHHGGVGSQYNHSQHSIANSPNLFPHQNYCNLTYVSTDGFASSNNITSQRCSPASQTQPAPMAITPTASTSHSLKNIESSPAGTVTMLMNFNTNQLQYPCYGSTSQLSTHQQQQQQFYQCQQQQNLLNKKLMASLTIAMPSPSHSPATPCNSSSVAAGAIPNIYSTHLDKSTTTVAATPLYSPPVVATKEYDSDSSLNYSATQTTSKYLALKTTMSSSSSTSSFSASSASTESLTQQNCSQPATPSLEYNYGGCGGIGTQQNQVSQHMTDQHHQEQKSINKSDSGNTIQQLPQIYRTEAETNNATSHSNLPMQSSNAFTSDGCQNQQQSQNQHCYNFIASNDHLTTSMLTNRSYINGDYWNPSYHDNQFIHHHLSPAQMALIPTPPPPATKMTSTVSCGSSSAPISPSLQSNDHIFSDGMHTQIYDLHQNIVNLGVSSSPPPLKNCLNGQFCNADIDTKRNFHNENGAVSVAPSTSNISSLNIATSAVYGSNISDIRMNSFSDGSDYKRGSPQLLAQQQQRLIAQQHTRQYSSSSSTTSVNSSLDTTLTNVVHAQADGGVNAAAGFNSINCDSRNNQIQPHNSLKTSNSVIANGSQHPQQLQQQQTIQHVYPHQQQQALSVPPPLPPHNLLLSNTQAYHIRPLNSSSSINSTTYDVFIHTPPDRFLARAHLVETKETPPTLLNNSKWDNLSQGIWTKFLTSQQTEETFKQKMRLWRYLYIIIKNAYPRFGLYLVGSTISGFGSDSSDVDMCLVSRSASNIEPRIEALFNLTVLRDILSKSGEFEHFNLIEAKVPILRFRDRLHRLEVDLNFNNCVGIKNTHLLYCYSQLDWRLRPLVLVTKLWAQYHNINNAKNMTISSYSLVLMVIHFLQYAVNPPVLPCLHDILPEKFPLLRSNDFGYVDMNETIGPYESKNTQSIGELFLYFLRYYSCFDYAQYAISVRTGGLLPINVCRMAKSLKNDIHQWRELCIEEPFDLTNTARSVYDYETFERVKAVFMTSWHILEHSLDLNSIFLPIITPSSIPTICGGGSISQLENQKTTAMATDVPNYANTKSQPPQQFTNINTLIKDFNFATTSANYKDSNSYNEMNGHDVSYNNTDAVVTTTTPHLKLYESCVDAKEFNTACIQQLPSYNLISSFNSMNYIQSNIKTKNTNNANSKTTTLEASATSNIS